jgi:transposase
MRAGIAIELESTDRQRLAAIVADRNTPQKHVWRAQIVLLTAEGCGTEEIMRQSGTAKTTVWRWQERFMTDGVAGLLHDKTRPSRIPPLSPAIERSVVTRTLGDPPGETTHWTAAAMAKESDISVSSVQRIWRKHGLQPHRARHSSCPTTRASPANCTTSSGSTSIHRPTPSCCRSMRRARSRRSTVASRDCQ